MEGAARARKGIEMIRLAVLLAPTLAFLPSVAFASPEDLDVIERECGTQLKMEPDACACLKSKASELKDGQQAFVAATVTKDRPLQEELMLKLTIAELTKVGLFMTNVPSQCARNPKDPDGLGDLEDLEDY